LILSLFLGLCTAAEAYHPVLEKKEHRFKAMLDYQMKDFHLLRHVRYFDVVRYSTLAGSVSNKSKLPKYPRFETIMKAGVPDSSLLTQTNSDYLAHALLKKDYFWQNRLPWFQSDTVYMLRFIDKADKHLKAIETRAELKSFLGKVDTPAELLLWLLAKESPYVHPYSYQKIKKGYRVRFLDDESCTCTYHTYFKFYDMEGELLNVEEIEKVVYDPQCPEMMI